MATILSFTPRTTLAKRPPPLVGAGAVIIFPGIRYERPNAVEPRRQVSDEVAATTEPTAPRH